MSSSFSFQPGFRRTHRSPVTSFLSGAFWVVFLVLLLPGVLFAAPNERTSPGDHPVPDSVLAGMRGGFSWAGVDFSFGIESSTFVNGTLMVKTILQTVGNELVASTGSNPFSSGGSPSGKTVLSSVSGGGISTSFQGKSLSKNFSGLAQTSLESAGTTFSASTKSFSSNGNVYSNVVQIQPAASLNSFQNLVTPSAFDNTSGIVSVLQNAANNLLIHNIVSMNGTVSNVGNITHVLSLNGMLQASRFLNR